MQIILPVSLTVILIYRCQCLRCHFQIKEYYHAIVWLLIITFDVVKSWKCEFQVHYLNKRDFLLTIWHMLFLEQHMNSFTKIRSQRSVFKSQFHNPKNLEEKNWFFFKIHVKAASNSERNKEEIKYALHWLLGGVIRDTKEIHAFFIRNTFCQLSLSVA